MAPVTQAKIARLVEARFEEEVAFLRELVRVPTDTPPGDNAPHAERTAGLLEAMGYTVERYPVPAPALFLLAALALPVALPHIRTVERIGVVAVVLILFAIRRLADLPEHALHRVGIVLDANDLPDRIAVGEQRLCHLVAEDRDAGH